MPHLRMIAMVAAFLAATAPAGAQEWPTRPLTMVVPAAAGGGLDVLGRILAQRLSEGLGQQVIVENVGGAGGMTGTSRVAKAAPDGYQFVLGGTDTFAQNQTLYKNPLYDAATDFAPVALIVELSQVLIARRDLPAGNLRGFADYVKANQTKMQFGSAGAGSTPHLVCTLLNAALGVKVTHIPYRGSAPAMEDLIAGRIDYMCPSVATAISHIEAASVKAVAILTKDRSLILPNLVSAREEGLTNLDAVSWYAFFLPKGAPAPIVQRLHDATVTTMDTPAVQKRLLEIGETVVAPERRSPDYLAKFVMTEIEKWAAPIKASGVSMD